MKRFKKGFTLVELLAVIVILIVISVIVVNRVNNIMKKNNENAVIANSETVIKKINENASTSRLTQSFYDGVYSIQQLYDMGLELKGTKPSDGQVVIASGKVYYACFVYEKYVFNLNGGNKTVNKGNECEDIIINREFAYTGAVQTYEVLFDGNYKLEVWGAQGGGAHHSSENGTAGKGGYSTGVVTLKAGDILYVYVGGEGKTKVLKGTVDGGFNGGGYGWSNTGGSSDVPSSGGGATDIRLVRANGSWYNTNHTSWLTDESLLSRIIVAGGGGGGGMDREAAGSGGGTSGISGNGAGGTQTTGHAFGKGADSTTANGANANYGGPGAGGGWYGGSLSGWRGAGGGSGFILTAETVGNAPTGYSVSSDYYLSSASTIAGNALMPTHDGTSTMTGNEGNGYAKITCLNCNESIEQDEFSLKFDGYQKVEYVQSNGNQYIGTGIIPNDSYGYYARLSSQDINNDKLYFGVKTSGYRFWVGNVSNQLYFGFNGSTDVTSITADTIYEIKYNYNNDRKFVVDSTVVKNNTDTLSTQSNPINIFGGNNQGSPDYLSSIKLYSFKITNGSSLVADYVPCYHKASGIVGLCDLVSATFKSSNTSTALSKGSDV